MDHYRLSPLDDRYRNLPYEFIEMCYVRYYNLPDPGKVRDYLVMKRDQDKKAEEQTRLAKENLDIYSDFDEDTKKMILQQFKGPR